MRGMGGSPAKNLLIPHPPGKIPPLPSPTNFYPPTKS